VISARELHLARRSLIVEREFVSDIVRKRSLEPLLKCFHHIIDMLIFHKPKIEMDSSRGRDSIFKSLSHMSAMDARHLYRRHQTYLRPMIIFFVFEDSLESKVRHDLLGIDLHSSIFHQHIGSDIFYIIIEIRHRDTIIHIEKSA